MDMDKIKEALCELARMGLIEYGPPTPTGERTYVTTDLGAAVFALGADSVAQWIRRGCPQICGAAYRSWGHGWRCGELEGHEGPHCG